MDTYRGDFTVNGSEFSYRQQQQARLAAHREANGIITGENSRYNDKNGFNTQSQNGFNNSIVTGNTLVPQNSVYNQLPNLERANSTTGSISSRATRQSIIRRKQEHAKMRNQEFSDSDDDGIPPIPKVMPPKTPNYQFDDPMDFDDPMQFHTNKRIQDYYHTQTSNI